MTGTWSDADARRRIRDDLDATLFVEASAGTGKTTALVDRVVRLVATGRAGIDEICAITFTEKAASELRDRIRRALARAAVDGDAEAQSRERCRRALEEIDDATLCTLHAFAQRILVEHPLEAGLPPEFEVLDDIEASATFEASWLRLTASLFEAADEHVRRAVVLGLTAAHLRPVAEAFRSHWDRIEDLELTAPPPGEFDAGGVLEALTAATGRLGECGDSSDLMARHLASLVPWVEDLASAPSPTDVLALLAEAPRITERNGQAANWGGRPVLDAVKADLDAAAAGRDRFLDDVRRASLAALASLLREFTLDAAAERRRTGRLEFHDLLVLARRLLRRHPEVRRVLRERWRHLLVDEFQDTDPLQAELAVLLAAPDGDVSDRPWASLPVDEGRLFTVGDPKQSIYRFRRADVGLYTEFAASVEAEAVTLTANFRSGEPIVDWVNAVLSRVMTSDEHQVEYSPLEATVEAPSASVRRLGGPSPEPVGVVRDAEADDIAATALAARDEGWLVRDAVTAAQRPARFADMAVLLPTRRLLGQLERAFSTREIPYRIESRSLLWSTQEVRDFVSLLRAIDDPADHVALVAALRSPALACRDDELLDWRRKGGGWSYLAPVPEGCEEHPVAHALAVLSGYHSRLHWDPMPVLVQAVAVERRVFELQTVHPRPRDHWRRLRFVLDRARASAEAGATTLRGFVEWAERQAEEEALVNESVVPEADDDAVRVLTVHAAKGLEFPIVFLAGLNVAPTRRRPPVLFGGPSGLEVAAGNKDLGFHTAGYDDLLAAEREAEDAERIRLLYVAATRARDHLVVSLHESERMRETHARALVESCPDLDDHWVDAAPAGTPAAEDVPPPAEPPSSEEHAARLENLRKASRWPAVAATALGDEATNEEERPEAPPWQRGRAGTSLGRAVHAVLQTVDLDTGEGLRDAALAQAGAEGITSRVADVERLARAALDSREVRRAVASGRYWREVYVAAPVDGGVVEGFVDLLYEEHGNLVVVDYKTDRHETGDGLPDRYRVQGAAYALALTEALDRPVSRCVFVFVGDGRAIEREVDDLDRAVDEARSLAAAAFVS